MNAGVRGGNHLMGLEVPGDQKIALPVRHWNALKLALWKNRQGGEIIARQASEILESCVHDEGCPGLESDVEPCLQGCLDRETRMSALVILQATKMVTPINAAKIANEPYYAPSRECFAEIVAELAIAQAENEAMRELLRQANIPAPTTIEQTATLPAPPLLPQLEALTP